jgi:hypothetical protein
LAGQSIDNLLNESVKAYKVDFKPLASKIEPPKPHQGQFSASSSQNNHPVKDAFDKNKSSRWCAKDGSTPQWIKVDLKKVLPIKGIDIIWERRGKHNYDILVSNDNKQWKKVASNNKNQAHSKNSFNVKARYVKVQCNETSGNNWVSIRELNVLTK